MTYHDINTRPATVDRFDTAKLVTDNAAEMHAERRSNGTVSLKDNDGTCYGAAPSDHMDWEWDAAALYDLARWARDIADALTAEA